MNYKFFDFVKTLLTESILKSFLNFVGSFSFRSHN